MPLWMVRSAGSGSVTHWNQPPSSSRFTRMPLPALLTIQSGINQLRYATLKGIMAAKKKEIRVVEAPAGLTPLVDIRSLAIPAKQKQTRLITGTAPDAARELVRALREDARVLEGGA